MHPIIHLVSSPRNVSTAFMYSFANRGDVSILDEPFYAYYLNKWPVEHPGKVEIIQSQPTDAQEVINQIKVLSEKRTVFIKNMAQHIFDIDLSFLYMHKIVFLVRNPKPQIASFSKVITSPTERDIGLKDQYDIYKYLKAHYIPFTIIDAEQLLKAPHKIINQLCTELNIPFTSKMLTWPAKPIPEDGIWAKYWYDSVHRSTCFKSNPKKTITLSTHLNRLYKEVLPYYEELFDHALKA